MDEARVGQKGGVTHVWYQKGARPRGVRQQGFASAYLFGAVCPERGEGVALILPESLPRTPIRGLDRGHGRLPGRAGARSQPERTPPSCSTGPAGTSATT